MGQYGFRGSALFITSVFLYIVASLLYAWTGTGGLVYPCVAGAFLCSMFLMLMNQTQALYLLILVTQIGPIAKVILPFVGTVTVGDIYLLLLTGAVLLKGRGATYFGPYAGFLPVFIVLSLATIAFSPGPAMALVGLSAQIEVALVYFLTLHIVKSYKQAQALIAMIGLMIVIAACIHVVAFLQGRNLQLLLGRDEIIDMVQEEARRSAGIYLKSQYFYSSFMACCAVGITLSFSNLMLFKYRSDYEGVTNRLFWFAVGACALISSFVSSNRTPIISAGLTIAVGLATYVFILRGVTFARSFYMLPISCGIILMVLIGYRVLVGAQLYDIFAANLPESGVRSVSDRLYMWSFTVRRFVEFPKVFLIGMGADIPLRVPDAAEVQGVLYFPGAQVEHPASFHNFYIDVVVQNGVFFLVAMMCVIVRTVARMVVVVQKMFNAITVGCLFSICAWLVVWNSHATGWSKPVMVLGQIFAISHLIIANRLEGRAE